MPRKTAKKKKTSKKRSRNNSWNEYEAQASMDMPELEFHGKKKPYAGNMKQQWKKQKHHRLQLQDKKYEKIQQKAESWFGVADKKREKSRVLDDENSDAESGISDGEDSDSNPPTSVYEQFVGTFGPNLGEDSSDEDEKEASSDDEGDAVEGENEEEELGSDDDEHEDDEENEDDEEEEDVDEVELATDEKENDDEEIFADREEEDEMYAIVEENEREKASIYRKRYIDKELASEEVARLDQVSRPKFKLVKSASELEGYQVYHSGHEPVGPLNHSSAHFDGMKSRLRTAWKHQGRKLSLIQKGLITPLAQYQDIAFCNQTHENMEELRTSYLMHVLNHVVSSRDTITKNNERVRRSGDVNADTEYRDQGFVRPSVLILCPFRSSALKIVQQLISLLPESVKQIHNKDRFHQQFGVSEEDEDAEINSKRPEEYKQVFDGNNDDCFQIGLSISRKALRLYTEYYHSDIIIASPLGLRLKIGAEGEEAREFDFLSSMEVVVLDQADLFLMQNWNHVVDIFRVLNQMPKEAHDADFSRIRNWNLQDQAKYYRQTVLLSKFQDPLMNGLFSKYCWNFKSCLRIRPAESEGSMTRVLHQLKQIFLRLPPSSSASEEPNDRFNYFMKQLLTPITEQSQSQTLIYIPSYYDYVRVRNQMNSLELNFDCCCEYTQDKMISRARTNFYHGRVPILLITGRFHFFRRYFIRGIRHLVFYSLPTYPEFYPQLINMMNSSSEKKDEMDDTSLNVVALFSKFDRYRLERIVGTKRVLHLLQSPKQTYLFY